MTDSTRPRIIDAGQAPIKFLANSYLPSLSCPMCGYDATHVDTVTVVTASRRRVIVSAHGEDERSSINVEVAFDADSLSSRRHHIALVVHCENGCVSSINFIQHKGTTYVEIV